MTEQLEAELNQVHTQLDTLVEEVEFERQQLQKQQELTNHQVKNCKDMKLENKRLVIALHQMDLLNRRQELMIRKVSEQN